MLAWSRGDSGDAEGLGVLQGCSSRRRQWSSAPLQANFPGIQLWSLCTRHGHNTPSWTLAHAQQDSEAAASAAADGADSGNIPGRCPLAGRVGDAACSSPQALGPGLGLVPEGSTVNPHQPCLSFPQQQGWPGSGQDCWSWWDGATPLAPLSLWLRCARMPFISRRHSPRGGSPSEVLCALSLCLISVAGGSLPRALAQCTIPASRCVLLLDTPAWPGHPVPTDGGGSWASMDASDLPLY